MNPLNNARITSPYGIERTINGKKSVHKGIDFVSDSGDREVKAIADGVVRGNFNDPSGFGNYVSIQHEDGTRALYAHLESFKRNVGDKVKAGDVIGIEGTTGSSTGIHLHLEIRDTPYMPRNHINVAEYLGIKNEVGPMEEITQPDKDKLVTYEDKVKFVQDRVGYEEDTCRYIFEFYKYGAEALDKLVAALGGKI